MTRRKESPRVLAVDLGGTKIATAVVGSTGRLTQEHEQPVDTSSPESPIDQIVALYRDTARTKTSVTAIGIAVPGLVRRDGTVWAPNLTGWDAVPLARELRQRLRLPVAVESDRNAAVLGESWRGAARGKSDVIVLIVGTGIGAGILSGGRLVRGAHELSGCVGWMVVTDARSEEGKRVGSLEALVGGPALARAANLNGAGAVSVAEAARNGDEGARDVFLQGGWRLGLAVANLVSLFDPEVIVLTGGVTSAADLFLVETRRSANEYAQPLSMPEVEIVVSELGSRANLLGAARLAFDAATEKRTGRRSRR
ncbi:MAG: ROK family protein [Thermoanaerobaculia bacterium]